ncbi:MAG: hypothetical protein DHS20C01_12530 [marine bacterium B5-7]|nr:MAG: hypothetical protein DHS20C01_12530 [marine bacterium B5-7]
MVAMGAGATIADEVVCPDEACDAALVAGAEVAVLAGAAVCAGVDVAG